MKNCLGVQSEDKNNYADKIEQLGELFRIYKQKQISFLETIIWRKKNEKKKNRIIIYYLSNMKYLSKPAIVLEKCSYLQMGR